MNTISDLLERIDLQNGREDCTCNVGGGSDNAAEHNRYCAFRLCAEAARIIRELRPMPTGPAGDNGQVGWMGGEWDR